MTRRAEKSRRIIESYAHAGKDRVNNPPVGLVTPDTDPDSGVKTYSHDPHFEPELTWAGKVEHTSFEVPTVFLHVHERIDPRTIIEAARKRNAADTQFSLFETPNENLPIRQAIEFYKHRHNWSNRLIAGDSLLVMNILLEYEEEIPGKRLHNIWSDLARPVDKRYVVQTADKILQRCILMTSDPGDLVFDPTCGSGTAAFVAEQWGRRWITCDTSRVAVSIARQRLMTGNFDYYKLLRPDEGVGGGIRCRSVAAVSAATLAYDEPARETHLFDQPFVDRSRARVTGPFTVEVVPAPVVKPIDDIIVTDPLPADESLPRIGETVRQEDWRDELFKTGIRGKMGQYLSFSRLEPLPGVRWIHAEGEFRPDITDTEGSGDNDDANHVERVGVSFGPDHAPLVQRQVAHAIEEAQALVPRPKVIVFAAFQFDPEASKDIDETNWPGATLLKAQMNADLLTADLKKRRASNESFWLIGQPDIVVQRVAAGPDKDKFRISVQGFDYFNTKTGALESGGAEKIALWMVDPDYDGRSLFARQVFFPMAGAGDGWAGLAKNIKTEIEAYRGTESLPFEEGDHRRAAVKILDDRGIESLKIVELE